MTKKLSGIQKYELCVDFLEQDKAMYLHSKPKMNDLLALANGKIELPESEAVTAGQLKEAMLKVFGFTSFRGQDKGSAFNELQNTCNHMIQWIIKLMETCEIPEWAIEDLRNDPLMPEPIRQATPRQTFGVKRDIA